MKKTIMTLTMAILSTSVFAQSLEERVDALETDGYLDIVKFSGTLKYKYDSVDQEKKATTAKSSVLATTSSQVYDISMDPQRVEFYLNADAKVSDTITFHGRLSASKFTSLTSRQKPRSSLSLDQNASRDEQGGDIYLEKAYFDWKLPMDLSLSIGRLPLIDGPPYHLYDNTARQGTYPVLTFDYQLDGMALTHSLNFDSKNVLNSRIVYTPFMRVGIDSFGYLIKGTRNQSPSGNASGASPQTPSENHMFTFMLDYSNISSPMWDSLNAVAMRLQTGKFIISDFVTRGTDINVFIDNPSNGTGDGAAITDSVDFAGSDLHFEYAINSAYFELYNIAKTGLNFSASWVQTEVESEGHIENNSAVRTALQGSLNLTGIGTQSRKETVTGDAWLVNASYKLPVSMLKNPTVGIEYLTSDKDYLFFQLNAEDLTGFYATRGDAYHFWWTQPMSDSLRLRLGYRMQDHEYSKGFLGEPIEIDLEEQTFYANLRLDF